MGKHAHVLVHGQYLKTGESEGNKSKKGIRGISDSDIVSCKWCKNHVIRRKVDRMLNHLLKCDKVPPTLKMKLDQGLDGPVRGSSSSVAILSSRVVNFSRKEIEDKQKMLTMFVVSSASPFALLENYWFRQFMKSLGLSNIIPCRNEVGGKILDKIYAETISKNESILNGE